MGYYNLPPSKLPTDLNPLEKQLRSLNVEGSIEALDLLEVLCRNVIQNPGEDKYRRVRTTNEKLKPLFGLEGILDVMQEMGWQVEGEFVVLPKDKSLDFQKTIVKILEAKSHFGKQRENAKKTAKMSSDPNKAGLLKQLEIDRRERAAAAAQGTNQPQVASQPETVQKQEQPAMTEDEEIQAALKMSLQEDRRQDVNPQDATTMSEEEQVKAALKASMHDAKPKSDLIQVNNTQAQQDAQHKVSKAPKSAFDFENRQHKEQREKAADMSLQELRALQKEKFKQFESDPNARSQEAYKKPPAVSEGGQEAGWFDWMWGGSSSSSGGGGGGGGGGGNDRQGPRMKTIRDLPQQPCRRGG